MCRWVSGEIADRRESCSLLADFCGFQAHHQARLEACSLTAWRLTFPSWHHLWEATAIKEKVDNDRSLITERWKLFILDGTFPPWSRFKPTVELWQILLLTPLEGNTVALFFFKCFGSTKWKWETVKTGKMSMPRKRLTSYSLTPQT